MPGRPRRTPRRSAKTPRLSQRVGRGALGAAVLGVGAAGGAEAATFTVTNLNDNGPGSLREAIVDANNAIGADTVTFQAGLTGTITLTTGQLYIADSVDIQGPGAAALTVSGNNASRVFYLYNSDAIIDVTISGLTVTGGNANIGGGIIDFDENLTLDSLVITGNSASGDGGGLWADGFNMNLTIRDCTISGNTAGDDGGGIYVEDTGGPLLIERTVISGNDAVGSGGGIYFYDPDNDVTVDDSTISGNTAGGAGGGVYLYSPDSGEFVFRQTTVSGNDAAAGGGVFFYSPDNGGGIENSTISGNQATGGNGGGVYLYNLYNFSLEHVTVAGNSASGNGGGVFTYGYVLPIGNSIVADNLAPLNADLGNGDAGAFDVSFSLVEDPDSATINDNGGNLLNQDPQLGSLANNGGPTLTHLPAVTSPAIDAGNSALTVDQRGVTRPSGAAVDMGAVETGPSLLSFSAATYPTAENAGSVLITVNRVGVDGAVSVNFATSNGSAVQPGDYTTAGGTLNWASGDGTPKTFNVTIIDDTDPEGVETINLTLSAPTGGAAIGAGTAQITIDTDPADVTTPTVDIPTLGELGQWSLIGLVGLAGALALRRRKHLAGAGALTLLLVAAPADAAPRGAKLVSVGSVELPAAVAGAPAAGKVLLTLADGSSLEVDASKLVIEKARGLRGGDEPGAAAGAGVGLVPVGNAAVIKIERNAAGEITEAKVKLYASEGEARAALTRRAERRGTRPN